MPRLDTVPTVHRRARPQPVPCDGKNYKHLRRNIRRLRRMHPGHMDVAWFADSLGLSPYSVAVAERFTAYGRTISTSVTAPLGRLP